MNSKISIIVPVYNMQELIDRCILSITNQTHKNIEIILVDDGSTDNSGIMCDNWAEKDNRIKVIHKANGGQGTARNMGLDIAKGDYIAFVDSDDYISEDMYEILIKDTLQQKADIVCCDSGSDSKVHGSGEIELFCGDEPVYYHALDYKGLNQSPCNKLFKRELFDGVRFPSLRAYEDCATIYKLFFKSKKVVYRDLILYRYIARENSTMSQGFSQIKFRSVDAYLAMYEDYEKYYPQYANIVKRKLMGACQYCIGESYKLKLQKQLKPEIEKAQAVLKNLSTVGLSPKLKLTRFLMIYVPSVFGMVYGVCK